MEHETDLKSTIRNSILILLFEFIGTTFLTLLYLCHANVSCPYDRNLHLSKLEMEKWKQHLHTNHLSLIVYFAYRTMVVYF